MAPLSRREQQQIAMNGESSRAEATMQQLIVIIPAYNEQERVGDRRTGAYHQA